MLSGSLSRGIVEEGSRGVAIIQPTIYYAILYSLLMLQDCLKMLVFDRLGSLSILAFCSSVHIYSLHLKILHTSIVLM
jgi:hypothetical protein